MKKVYISHSYNDMNFVASLESRLKENHVKVVTNHKAVAANQNVANKISELLNKSTFCIVVLSKSSVKSEWVNFELSATILVEALKQRNIIIPIIINDCEIPFAALKDKQITDFRGDYDSAFNRLLEIINTEQTANPQLIEKEQKGFEVNLYKSQLNNLKSEYNKGDLVLFCGAGTSYDAGIPTWDGLLSALMKAANLSIHDSPIVDIDKKLADVFQKRIGVSPLILGKYLKSLIGKDFESIVRDTLYRTCTYSSKTVDSIAELSRKREGKKSLKAVVTFNFDDVIENKLLREKIGYKSIFCEGEKCTSEKLPVYHAHGFLPKVGKLTQRNNIVFSEDGYHSQFIDSFSWSNLIQLHQLNHSTCLFIGISLTDPNMRRLLDIAARKGGGEIKNHYIIKRRHNIDTLYRKGSDMTFKDPAVIPVVESIEEQDAKDLGFNVIWINDYDEVPLILDEIWKS